MTSVGPRRSTPAPRSEPTSSGPRHVACGPSGTGPGSVTRTPSDCHAGWCPAGPPSPPGGLRGAGVIGAGVPSPRDRRAAVHAHGNGTGHRDPLTTAMGLAVVEDGDVLGGPIVPNGQVTDLPPPPDGVLHPDHILLEDPDEVA